MKPHKATHVGNAGIAHGDKHLRICATMRT